MLHCTVLIIFGGLRATNLSTLWPSSSLEAMEFVLMIKGLFMTSLLALMTAADTVTATADEGYVVETVLDGNKLGLSVYSIHADVGDGGLVVALDVAKSSLLRFLASQGSDSMKRIAGSPEGKAGYRDGHAEEALFNHPKNLAVDDDGNIYIADPKNFAIRKLSKTGFVTTIAGGSNKTGHTDGKGQEATFSNDFAVTYVHSCCCLLVADHGNRMIRQIRLPQVDGQCPGVIPKAPRRHILWDVALHLAFFGAGVVLTILAFKGRSMERCFQNRTPTSMITGAGPQEAYLLPSSILQRTWKIPTTTIIFTIRNAAVEFFVRGVWLEIAEGALQLFAYVVLYIISFPLQLFSMSTTTASANPMPQPPIASKVDQGETDLLGLGITKTLDGPQQIYNQQVCGGLTSRRKSSSQPHRTFTTTAGSGSTVISKDSSRVNTRLKMSSNEGVNMQLADLIDLSEPEATNMGNHPQFSLI